MSENSKIEWTDHTFNPWIGCAKVSPGCLNCYAETQNKLRQWNPAGWGKGVPRKRTSEANWRKPRAWNGITGEGICQLCAQVYAPITREAHDTKPLFRVCTKCEGAVIYRRPRVFCASLADWLDDEVLIELLADLLALIHATPNLDWLLLTKRPENFRGRMVAALELAANSKDEARFPIRFIAWMQAWLGSTRTGQFEPPANVWIGTTVEDQTRADARIPALLRIPAKVRFLSCEPLLGPVLLDNGETSWLSCSGCDGGDEGCRSMQELGRHFHGVDWVICGGESGPGARPMHPGWARSLRDQCQAADVPFFFKQNGEWLGEYRDGTDVDLASLSHEHAVAVGDRKTNHVLFTRVGKKAAGRLLDGRTHDAFPSA